MSTVVIYLLLNAVPYTPTMGCHALIDARCDALRAEDALRCRNEADAQCDIADAEQFIAVGDVNDAGSRIAQACGKYEDLLNMMIPDIEPTAIAATMVRYAGVSASVFALLAREGEVEDLTHAVVRLRKSHEFLSSLLARREELAQDPDLSRAVSDLTVRLAVSLDHLARREMQRADERFRSVGRDGRNDGGAKNYYRQAAIHAGQAYALVSKFPYKLNELDAKLAQADLHATLARETRADAPLACAAYRALRDELAILKQYNPEVSREDSGKILKGFTESVERGARACTANPRIAAGATMLGVGAAGLGVAIGLYAQYAGACQYGISDASGKHECLGIPIDGGETDRYTAQVRASIGLAVAGSAVLVAGTSLMTSGLVQRMRARPRRFMFTPNVTPRHAGVSFQLRF